MHIQIKKGEKQDLNINAIPNNMEKYMAFMLGNHPPSSTVSNL